jgi:hypothetical protein
MNTPAGETAKPIDLTTGRLASFLLWKFPAVIMVGIAIFDLGPRIQALVWAPCLAVFAAGCIANAVRCRRVHCFFTGPFFLAMAVISLLHGFGFVSLGDNGWSWVELITIGGGLALVYLPELAWGRYFGTDSTRDGEQTGIDP